MCRSLALKRSLNAANFQATLLCIIIIKVVDKSLPNKGVECIGRNGMVLPLLLGLLVDTHVRLVSILSHFHEQEALIGVFVAHVNNVLGPCLLVTIIRPLSAAKVIKLHANRFRGAAIENAAQS